jgi:hypothetical protein
MDINRESDWPTSESSANSGGSLPRPELNPLMNPLLGKNMGRWAQVYFTAPPEKREQAVEELLRQLELESGQTPVATLEKEKPVSTTPIHPVAPIGGSEHSALLQPDPAKPELETNSSPSRPSLHSSPPPFSAASFSSATPGNNHKSETVTVECVGCHHRNAAEQRFCGLCGLPMNGSAARRVEPVAQVARPILPPVEREPDWQWLRERSLSHLNSVESNKSYWRIIVGLVAIVMIVGLSYFAWTKRDRSNDEDDETTPAAQQQSGTPVPIPEPTQIPSAAPEKQPRHSVPGAEGNADRPAPRNPANKSAQNEAQPAETSESAVKGNGNDELNKARQFLDGQGVRKDSGVAAQWLWKSVSKQNEQAVLLLSDLYMSGTGVPHSCEQARVLLVAAAKRGSAAAAHKLRNVETGCR